MQAPSAAAAAEADTTGVTMCNGAGRGAGAGAERAAAAPGGVTVQHDSLAALAGASDEVGSRGSPVTSEAGSVASLPDVDEDGVPYSFEGPEKVLEIDFVPRPDVAGDRGCRAITREQWDAILTAARCTILCSASNAHLDSYVLSESSLFVYAYKVTIKTCGTTTLLRAVEPLLEVTEPLGLRVEWVGYTRKNFESPSDQMFPHSNFTNEVKWLKNHFPAGHAYVLGPITDDHWFIFVADYMTRSSEMATDRTLDLMMFDLDPDFSKLFWKDPSMTDSEVTIKSGIRDLMPTATIQEHMFEPCGYSMNALLFDSYYTIHITPEAHCSYASFETNVRQRSYASLVRNVLSVFRPKRFTLTLFADQCGLDEMDENPWDPVEYVCPNGAVYKLHSRSNTKFEGDYCSFMGNFRRVADVVPAQKPSGRSRTASIPTGKTK